MTVHSLANHNLTLSSGLQLAYYDSGEGSGVLAENSAIVLLHGFCGSSSYWESIIPRIQGLGRILIPDLRGHGRSSAPDDAVYAMEAFADDLLQLVDALHVRHVYLFGHSLGGYVSLAFADKYPEKVSSLSLVHSTAMADTAEAKLNRDKAAQAIATEGIEKFVEGLVPKLFAPAHLVKMADKVQEVIAIGYGTSAAGAAATALGMKIRADRRDVLDELNVPRLLIAGSEDGVIPAEKTFTAEGSNVSQVVLNDTGHMGMVESPAALGERIAAFIRFLSTLRE
ncbi:alpha/beta hydrolase [Paenibacillus oenotherae]|uniref:Alpha/beta hydrolase n=1 Tax=Paenibacillus oenotherae TaxID=1435645 RepID=A0ABS7DAE7_9BACL|nr:alpha/beta hydrolase [Paenibacillus oenotherae]MBW7476769.1 alpha/beta hydrolase [Paenibacillus oenotherae]